MVELENEADAVVAETRQRLVAQREGVFAADLHPARVGTRKRAHDLQERRLAGTAGPDDGDHLALPDPERDALEHLQLAEAFAYVCKSYHSETCRSYIPKSRTVSTASRTSCTRRIAAPWRRHSHPSATDPASEQAGVVPSTL